MWWTWSGSNRGVRLLGTVAALLVAVALAACGEDDPASGSGKSDATTATGSEQSDAIPTEQTIQGLVVRSKPGAPGASKPTEPLIEPPYPLPKGFLIEDLREGSGPPAKRADKLTLKYLAVNESGETSYSSWWRGDERFKMNLGSGLYLHAFEEGMEGMKAGGRRAMVIPASRTEGLGPLVYVVDLLTIQ